ncbi:MAG: helix-turn-helix domain-containing protein [Phycisphaeraceae bacterium]
MPSDRIVGLTPREREILVMIAEGDSLPEIAQKLGRSQKTIESHRLSLGRKLNVSNRVELAKIAITEGLIELPAGPSTEDGGRGGDMPLIKRLNDAIDRATGAALLQRFCQEASKLPGIRCVGICTRDPDAQTDGDPRLERITMALSEEGEISEPVRYNARQTPCERVMTQGECLVEQGVQEAFPNDPWLASVQAESFYGVMLNNDRGEAVGGVKLVSDQRMSHASDIRRVIAFFEPRLAGALQSIIEQNAMRAKYDELAFRASSLAAQVHARLRDEHDDQAHAMALGTIIERTHPLAGAAFLRGIVDAIGDEFGLTHAGICTLQDAHISQTLRSVILRVDGAIADQIEYDTEGTPCEIVVNEGYYYVSENVADKFPDDDVLVDHELNAYLGVRLPGPGGTIAGTIWAACRGTMHRVDAIAEAMKYFAPRVGAELVNYMRLEELLQRDEANNPRDAA